MAAMIDVIFLLLIFFFVSAKWRPSERYLPLQLASAGQGNQTLIKVEPLRITIFNSSEGCTVNLGNFSSAVLAESTIESDLAALIEKLNEVLNSQKRLVKDPVEIICSPAVKWDYIAKIYNSFYGAGLTDITFVMTE
jgi:biopolymer transport protein ExbD